MRKDAGEFSDWLNSFIKTMKGESLGDVPCGDCVGCCTSSKFILVRPSDTEAKSSIPKELLFSAPGFPNGFQLMGYDEKGHCPMFKNGKCSIYESRPETCRQYDCRVLAATGAAVEDESAVIVERVNSWEFSFRDSNSLGMAKAIKRSMAFLKENSERFPSGYIPRSDSQLAALAIRVHEEFSESSYSTAGVDELVHEITEKYPPGGQT